MKNNRYRGSSADSKPGRLKLLMYIIVAAMCILFIIMIFFVVKGFNDSAHSESNTVSEHSVSSTLTKDEETKVLTLVNPEHQLPTGFKLDLVDFNGIKCDKILKNPLSQLLQAAKAEGYQLEVTKGYVDKDTQQELHNNLVNIYIKNSMSAIKADDEASKTEPAGNFSDMQTGLCIDITMSGLNENDDFSSTVEYKWLMSNCIHYGFIQRFPVDKTSETNSSFNPSRYKYVGTEHAEQMRRLNMSFEKYYEHLHSR